MMSISAANLIISLSMILSTISCPYLPFINKLFENYFAARSLEFSWPFPFSFYLVSFFSLLIVKQLRSFFVNEEVWKRRTRGRGGFA